MKEKKAHGVQLLLRCVVKDPDGKVITDTGRNPSKSFVIAFLQGIHRMFLNDATAVKNTAGANTVIWGWTAGECFRVDAPINTSTWGLVVGTGDTAEDNEDWKLDVQLTEGAGAGNITHGSVTVGAAGVVGANVDMEIKRAFTNNTGSSITVKEAGIYTYYSHTPGYHCIGREVLPTPVDVPNRCSLAVYYTLRTTV